MKYGYYFAYSSLAILLVAFIPAMIAANRERRFAKWYLYSVLFLPIAFIHSFLLKRPTHRVNVYHYDRQNPSQLKKKSYKKVPVAKKQITVTLGYLNKVFFSKLLFGVLAGVVLFALFRTMVYSTKSLITACSVFSVVFAVFFSVVEICRFSTLPLIADEITKRALSIAVLSALCSFPLFLLNGLLLQNVLDKVYCPLGMFICTLISFGLFLFVLLKKQSIFYRVFNRFFDYCTISILSYCVFAAMSLIWLSVSGIQKYIYVFAMPMQIFNISYMGNIKQIGKLNYIYSSAFVHLLIAVILLFSGLLCRKFKKKEFEFRVEYRAKAFNMTHKAVLRRHIPRSKLLIKE